MVGCHEPSRCYMLRCPTHPVLRFALPFPPSATLVALLRVPCALEQP